MSDLQFWLFLAVAIPILLLPAGIAAWKGRNLWPVIALSLVFWPGALGLALRTRRRTALTGTAVHAPGIERTTPLRTMRRDGPRRPTG